MDLTRSSDPTACLMPPSTFSPILARGGIALIRGKIGPKTALVGDLRADPRHMARQEQQVSNPEIGFHRAAIGAVIADEVKVWDIQPWSDRKHF